MAANTEYEIKILEINVDKIIDELQKLGAILIYDRFLRNTIFYTLNNVGSEYIRVRDDGMQVTVTHKMIHSDSITAIEQEMTVDSYDNAVKIFELSGLKIKRIDEKKRKRYKLNSITFDIDTWPGIPTYLEIEGVSASDLHDACHLIDVKFEDRFIGDTLDVFRYYNFNPDITTKMNFNNG